MVENGGWEACNLEGGRAAALFGGLAHANSECLGGRHWEQAWGLPAEALRRLVKLRQSGVSETTETGSWTDGLL